MGQESKLTRGVRNCNPLNIRRSQCVWIGCLPYTEQRDREYEQFRSMAYGLRAAMVLLTRYHQDHVLTHVSQIVHRWAPAADGNNEEAYTKFVEAQMTGILGTDGFVPASRQALYALVTAMSRMESGYIPLDQELDAAWHKLPASARVHWK